MQPHRHWCVCAQLLQVLMPGALPCYCLSSVAMCLLPCQAIKAASRDLMHVDGICTFCEMAVPLVSRLAEALGLPGNTPEAVDAARDKVGGQLGV